MNRFKLLIFTLVFAVTGCGTAVPVQKQSATTKAQETPQVQRTLNDMISAYQNKDLQGFGAHVSDRYFGDKTRLLIRVSRDFRVFDDIIIHPEVTSIREDGHGKAFVEATYNRSHTDLSSGRRTTQSAQVSLLFELEDGRYRLVSQRPALFGLR